MVALQILVLTVGVRILLGELKAEQLFQPFFCGISIFYSVCLVPSSIGLGRDPLKVERRVRLS